MEATMHSVEHKSSQIGVAVKMKELAAGKRRSCQSLFIGATALLVLFVILAGALSSCSQLANSSTHSGSAAVPTPATTTISKLRSIPAPTAKPINSPVWTQHNVSMVTVDGVAYAGTMDNAVYALRINNGSMLWHTGIDGFVEESPAVANGIVYVSSYVGQNGPSYLYALRASDGKVLWRYSGNSNYIYSPIVDNGVAYATLQNDSVIALRASDGVQLWRFATPAGSQSPVAAPVNGILYVSTPLDGQAGGVVALRAS